MTAVGSGASSSAKKAGSIAYAPLTKNYGPTNTAPASGPGPVTKSGTGWATVLSGPAGQLLGTVQSGPLSEVTTVVKVHGQVGRLFSTELLSVLVMPNGRFYAGLVTPSVLEAAASANT